MVREAVGAAESLALKAAVDRAGAVVEAEAAGAVVEAGAVEATALVAVAGVVEAAVLAVADSGASKSKACTLQ